MPKILVVDDSKTIRDILAYVLKFNEYEVDTASDGLMALEKVFSINYDLLITDINMPKMDGYKLIESIREENSYRFLPIIILTTESKEEDRRKGIRLGADLFLIKPPDPDSLLAYVKMLISGSQNRKV